MKSGPKPTRQRQEITQKLCTKCGLCCDGSLFPAVRAKENADTLPVVLGAKDIAGESVARKSGWKQPCPALNDGLCAIYENRPSTCQKFVCRTLRLAWQGVLDEPAAIARIEQAKAMLDEIKAYAAVFEIDTRGKAFSALAGEIETEFKKLEDRKLRQKMGKTMLLLVTYKKLIGINFLPRRQKHKTHLE